MKIALLLLLVAASHAAKVTSTRSKQKTEHERRTEGSDGIEKRAPLLPTVSPSVSPGVEYAEDVSKNTLQEKSPTHQIYATPVPQAAKISDVLAQGPPFQNAIANQLYSPVSVYQSKFPTYEVSQPVPSQLAYAEHSIQPNSIQSIPKQNFAANYQPQVYQPQDYQLQVNQYNQGAQYQDNQFGYVQEPIAQQPLYRQEPERINYQVQQVKSELPAVTQNPQIYSSQQQGAISYASFTKNQLQQEQSGHQPNPQAQPLQLVKYQLQHQPIQTAEYQPQIQQAQIQNQHQIQQQTQIAQQTSIPQIKQQPQIIEQASIPQIQYQPQITQQRAIPQIQHQPQITHQAQIPQVQYQPQIKTQPQYQIPQYQQPQYDPQSYQQPQYIEQQYQPQYQIQQQFEPQQIQQYLTETKAPQVQLQQLPAIKQKNAKQAYFKQLTQPLLQTKSTPQYSQAPVQNAAYSGQVALPTFPPVQYFGKFAQNIFGQYQH